MSFLFDFLSSLVKMRSGYLLFSFFAFCNGFF